ncbi:hydantoin utilization protein [Nostoc sp. 'Peltigera membranacea cyanobiont' 210A]|uniref:HupE/UreJ family protein n=1 Tax=Nostoc sp. 'Peltigera membranacea cyanobiont' 210A TaxID=2014529 RepID=UPI000B95521C|nr:HupE/UreJ family protein [Nostoc sp. 'Peltigera membranacea cyanobiont' 210A]OYD93923.1 hydantoin utilization protein [Nostoc sp. 'Peltigera membranacea cyanobiont' 210A]
MFKTKLSESRTSRELNPSKFMDRHIGAIAALILISLLSSLSGTPFDHNISNGWEAFVWGLADPVISLNCLVGIVAIGLLSSVFVRGAAIAGCFVLATVLGIVIHIFQLDLPGTEIAIAISTIVFGTMLMMPNQLNFLVLALVGISAGLFQGYANAESIVSAGTISVVAYILGIALTLFAVAMSARAIGVGMGMGEINRTLPWKISLGGFALCAIGIVFLSNSLI